MNGVASTNVTDTLRISYAEINLVSGSVMAFIERGTVTPAVAAVAASAPGVTPVVAAVAAVPATFVANMPKLRVQLNADGTFASTDGSWKGSVPAATAAAFVTALQNALEAFVLAAGLITGTAN